MKTLAETEYDTKERLYMRRSAGDIPWKTIDGNCRDSYEDKGPWTKDDLACFPPKNTTRTKFATNPTIHTSAILGPGGVINPFGAISVKENMVGLSIFLNAEGDLNPSGVKNATNPTSDARNSTRDPRLAPLAFGEGPGVRLDKDDLQADFLNAEGDLNPSGVKNATNPTRNRTNHPLPPPWKKKEGVVRSEFAYTIHTKCLPRLISRRGPGGGTMTTSATTMFATNPAIIFLMGLKPGLAEIIFNGWLKPTAIDQAIWQTGANLRYPRVRPLSLSGGRSGVRSDATTATSATTMFATNPTSNTITFCKPFSGLFSVCKVVSGLLTNCVNLNQDKKRLPDYFQAGYFTKTCEHVNIVNSMNT